MKSRRAAVAGSSPRSSCVLRTMKWGDDSTFPAQCGLWSPRSPLSTPEYWSSMQDIAKASGDRFSVFGSKGPLYADIKQDYSSCLFAALFSILYRYPEFVDELFVKRELWNSGVFTVLMCVRGADGIPRNREIEVDSMLPAELESKRPFFAKPRNGAFWVPIFEKAFATICGSWPAYESASLPDAYASICRAPIELYQHAEYNPENIWDMLTTYIHSYPMVTQAGDAAYQLGLVMNQCYVILSIETGLTGFDQCLCLFSTCENDQFSGELAGIETCSVEGSFFVTLEEFMSVFDATHVCTLNKLDVWVRDGDHVDLDPFWLKMWSSDAIKDLKVVLEHDERTHWHRNKISTPARLQRLWVTTGEGDGAGDLSELPGYSLICDCDVWQEQPLIMTRWRPDQIDWAERVCKDAKCFDTAPDIIKHDPMICSQLVCRNGMMLEKLIRPLRGDRVIVRGAVRQNGLALYHAQAALKNDRELVHQAVVQNGLALQHASAALKDDTELVLEAIKQNPMSLRFASAAIRSDPQVVYQACSLQGSALECATEEFRLHADLLVRKTISLLAVAQDGLSLAYTAPDLRLDGDVVLIAVCQNPDALKWADPWFRNHRFILNVSMGKSKAPTGSWKSLKEWAEKNGQWEGCWDALKDWHANHPEE